MTRLARHDEIVERMARACCLSYGHNPDLLISPPEDPRLCWEAFAKDAAAALDALLTAVVELGVARKGFGWPFDGGEHWEADTVPQRDGTDFPAIILQLEDKP